MFHPLLILLNLALGIPLQLLCLHLQCRLPLRSRRLAPASMPPLSPHVAPGAALLPPLASTPQRPQRFPGKGVLGEN